MALFVNDQEFFHGLLSRAEADESLRSAKADGAYLVRMSSNSAGSYVISLMFKQDGVLHFQIKNQGECWFSIDDGPMFEGLDDVISHYSHLSDGLPTPLLLAVKAPSLKKPTDGNNKLATACLKGDAKAFKKHLSQPSLLQPNVHGRTAVHELCRSGNETLLAELLALQGKFNVNIDSQDYRGWTPLHLAAACGSWQCVRQLISAGADLRLKSKDKETARHVAARLGSTECCKILGDAESGARDPAAFEALAMPYFHGKLNRLSGEHVLSVHGLRDGLFLVRKSSSVAGDYVLTMCFEGGSYHFQIQHEGANCFYIDDGPVFKGLESVIEYYTKCADGLPCQLRQFARRSKRTFNPASAVNEEDLYETANFTPAASAPQPVAAHGSNAKATRTRQTSAAADNDTDYDRMDDLDSLPGLPPAAASGGAPHIIPEKEIELMSQLGAGEFGAVYKARWTPSGGAPIEVAVKTMRDELIGTADAEFMREANLMVELKNANVVRLLGISLPPKLMIVQELMPLGALQDYLEDRPWKIENIQLAKWAFQVASGMSYLEKKNFVHRDLATRNVLLNAYSEAKISDFGLSRVYEDNYYKASQGGKWPIKWYAPECIYYGKFTSRSDVWSFGVTMWEIWSFADMPYGDMSGQQVLALLEKGDRLAMPKKCPASIYAIMKECWEFEADNRPSFGQLLIKFRGLISELAGGKK